MIRFAALKFPVRLLAAGFAVVLTLAPLGLARAADESASAEPIRIVQSQANKQGDGLLKLRAAVEMRGREISLLRAEFRSLNATLHMLWALMLGICFFVIGILPVKKRDEGAR